VELFQRCLIVQEMKYTQMQEEIEQMESGDVPPPEPGLQLRHRRVHECIFRDGLHNHRPLFLLLLACGLSVQEMKYTQMQEEIEQMESGDVPPPEPEVVPQAASCR
jgi:hypothetical protein